MEIRGAAGSWPLDPEVLWLIASTCGTHVIITRAAQKCSKPGGTFPQRAEPHRRGVIRGAWLKGRRSFCRIEKVHSTRTPVKGLRRRCPLGRSLVVDSEAQIRRRSDGAGDETEKGHTTYEAADHCCLRFSENSSVGVVTAHNFRSFG